MKRIISIFLVMLLIVALAVPAFAAEYDTLGLPPLPEDVLSYAYIHIYQKGDTVVICASNEEPYMSGSEMLFPGDAITYNRNTDKTGWWGRVTTTNLFKNIYGMTLIYSVEPEKVCDGTACPATDANHDNICDDCGNVLAYSLRSDLLTYAYTHLASGQGLYTSDDFWLITENEEGGYYIYLSNEPFTYGMSTAILSSDGTMHTSSVIVMSTGQNGGRGWQTKSPGTALPYGNPVASSHDIEGFFPGALWEEMEAVTQGAIVAEQIRLNRTMGILVTTGVGLVALLVLFRLLARKSLIYRG